MLILLLEVLINQSHDQTVAPESAEYDYCWHTSWLPFRYRTANINSTYDHITSGGPSLSGLLILSRYQSNYGMFCHFQLYRYSYMHESLLILLLNE